jgi:C4-dicarboxylate-specific signal transduction histidine kinase
MVLKQHNTDVITMEKPVEIPKLIKEGNIDVVLLDMNFSPGIPEENLGNIFIPFFSTKKEGSGMG